MFVVKTQEGRRLMSLDVGTNGLPFGLGLESKVPKFSFALHLWYQRYFLYLKIGDPRVANFFGEFNFYSVTAGTTYFVTFVKRESTNAK
jgi:hypothetical protein